MEPNRNQNRGTVEPGTVEPVVYLVQVLPPSLVE